MIRIAVPADGEALAGIYDPIVAATAISFEQDPPGAEEMARRVESTLPRHPWLVLEESSRILGYAYAAQHRARPAYQWATDVSVYVAADARRGGLGSKLYSTLLSVLRAQGFHTAHAGITLPNPPSVGLHEKIGFQPVGVYEQVGWKLGRWHDVGWWSMMLDPSHEPPDDPSLVDQIDLAGILNGNP